MKDEELLQLILNTAKNDERIRAVMLNGSRTNPNAPKDIFQDFDIVYFVADVASFTANHSWIDRFGERMILQMPETMGDPPPANNGYFAYLIQLADGNRIDLTLSSVAKIGEQELSSLSLLLLDKDNFFKPLPPPSEQTYLPKPPTAQAFADSCNEFWWVCPYVAKGLWRQEITYAKYTMDHYVRDQLMKMLDWYVGVNTNFLRGAGKFGKNLQQNLEPPLWQLLQETYVDADYNNMWDALDAAGILFRKTAQHVPSISIFNITALKMKKLVRIYSMYVNYPETRL